jgi:hypothetical protein
MSWFRRQRFLALRWALFLSILTQIGAPARALSPFPGSFNNLMTQTMEARGLRMGFVATDPRILATVEGMGDAAAGMATDVAVGAAAGTALTWGAVILGAVIIGAGVYYLASDHKNSVKCDSLTDCVMSLLSGSGHASLDAGSVGYWTTAGVFNVTVRCSEPSACAEFHASYMASQSTSYSYAVSGLTQYSSSQWNYNIVRTTLNCSTSCTSTTAGTVTHNNGTYTGPTCASGVASYSGSNASTIKCFDLTPNPVHSNPLALPDALAPSELAKPMDPSLAALTANKLWQRAAAQPGYAGIPYSVTDPITTADMTKIQTASPSTWPTLGDLDAPVAQGAVTGTTLTHVPLPANGTKTATDPGYVPAPAKGTNPSTQPLENLGTDPGVSAPDATSETATATSIVDPLFNWFPSISGMNLSVPSGSCPTDSFDIWGKHLVLDQHCAFFEQYRAVIAAAMLAVWTMAAAVVLLRA